MRYPGAGLKVSKLALQQEFRYNYGVDILAKVKVYIMGASSDISEKKSYKLNFMIDQEVKEALEQHVPSGSRSRVVNEALRRELDLLKRKNVADKLAEIRNRNVKMDTAALVTEVKKGRDKDR